MKRYSYFRQFAPSLLAHLPVALEATGSPALLEAVEILRDLNTTGQRTLPEDLPLGCVPKRLRPFVGTNGTRNRRAYECAVLTALRDEIKRGNVWIPGSKRFGKLEDFFLPDGSVGHDAPGVLPESRVARRRHGRRCLPDRGASRGL